MRYNHRTPVNKQELLSSEAKAESILLYGSRDEKKELRTGEPQLCKQVFTDRISTNRLISDKKKKALGSFISIAYEKYDTAK